MFEYSIIIVVALLIVIVLLKKFCPSIYSVLTKCCRQILKRIVKAILVLLTGEPTLSNKGKKTNGRQLTPDEKRLRELVVEIERQKGLLAEEKATSEELRKSISKMSGELEQRNFENKKLCGENQLLQNAIVDLKGRFTPVNRTSVAETFCLEFRDVSGVLKEVETKVIHIVCSICVDAVSNLVVGYFKNRPQICEDVNTWYLTLNGAGVLTGTAGVDVRGLKRDEDILTYLRRHAFTDYYRPMASHLFLLIEQIRTRVDDMLVRAEFDALSDYLLTSLAKHEIDVIYLQAGMTYNLDEYSDVIIKEPVDNDHPVNYIEEVLHYGVNHRVFDVVREKTEVRMSI